MNPDREHVSTSLYDFRGSVNRPGWPVPPEIALDHPYAGLVVTWLDRTAEVSHDDLVGWTCDHWLFSRLSASSPIAQALVFTPRDFPGIPGTGVGVGEKVCVAWFLQCDPRDAWDSTFAHLADDVGATGAASLGLAAAFVPVLWGTDTYLDELW